MTQNSTSRPALRLGTRRSPLAMAQATETRARICAAHGWPEEAVELIPVVASGDKIQDRPLAEIGGKALWTRELDQWLLEGRIDGAVHSMKDVETQRPTGLVIAAILPRADRRDVLIGARTIAGIPQGASLGTSAPRRAAQMRYLRPDLKVVLFRGNVATRIAKLAAGDADVTLLAKAGLDRLGEEGVGTPLEPDEFLPAPAQGAIGIECRAADARMRDILAAVDHAPSHAEIAAERALLAQLGGNCQSPVALDCRWHDGGQLFLRVALFSPDGTVRVDGEQLLNTGDKDGAADCAADLLDRAPPAIQAVFRGG